jgi:hypothetical protein
MTDIIKKQILRVRDTCLTNMFDLNNVKFIAEELDLIELKNYIENSDDKREYITFIINGKL